MSVIFLARLRSFRSWVWLSGDLRGDLRGVTSIQWKVKACVCETLEGQSDQFKSKGPGHKVSESPAGCQGTQGLKESLNQQSDQWGQSWQDKVSGQTLKKCFRVSKACCASEGCWRKSQKQNKHSKGVRGHEGIEVRCGHKSKCTQSGSRLGGDKWAVQIVTVSREVCALLTFAWGAFFLFDFKSRTR